MPQLILLRHGESIWNRDDRFTGWTDVDLSDTGIEEAHAAARMLTLHGITPALCFTSVLKRAIRTLWIVLEDMDLMWLPVSRSWRLNERHYGALQGQNKDEKRKEAGEEQVHRWRRSYSVRPPALSEDDERFPGHEQRYALLPDAQTPRTESLEDCIARMLPYWHMEIEPELVVAYGNSMRGIVKYLDDIADNKIPGLEIPTGVPLVYEFDEALRPLESRYLGEAKGSGGKQPR